jgi:hypothetical protein
MGTGPFSTPMMLRPHASLSNRCYTSCVTVKVRASSRASKKYSQRHLFKMTRRTMTQPTLSSNVRSNTSSIAVDHLDYQAVAERGAPIGSGAVESQCSQFRDRFKRTGQFWTRPGLRNLLALHVMTQNKTFAYLWN